MPMQNYFDIIKLFENIDQKKTSNQFMPYFLYVLKI